jgi:RecJ-like exonuclease
MDENQSEIKEFIDLTKQAAKKILETVQKDGFVHVFSHLDADGISAAGIIGKMLFRLGAKFRLRVTQWVDEKIIEEIIVDKPQLVIFTDFGSNYLELLNEKVPESKVVILDHHQFLNEVKNDNFFNVNPHIFNIPGATDVSGSGIAYFVARAVNPKNVDLSPIAIVGALGDMQDKNTSRTLCGLNSLIVEDALVAHLIEVKKDLIFFGRETRPIHRALASSNRPYLPGITGEEGASAKFLKNLDIDLKENQRWRSLRDLTPDERKKLSSALANYLLDLGLHFEVENLIGTIYVLSKEEPLTPLRDAREFAVLLNSTGRMDRPSLGLSICMGDRASSLKEANQTLEDYRKSINKYLCWVKEKPERMKEFKNIYVIYGDNFINEKIIGTISSILVSSLQNLEKPLIAYANVEEENAAKFSARTTGFALRKGINLGEIMREAAGKFEGKGGGHNIAAGAQVPIDQIENFISLVNTLVGKQLTGIKIGSQDNS